MGISEDIMFVDTMASGPPGDDASQGLVTLPSSWQIGYGTFDEEHQSLVDFINEGWREAGDGGAICVRKVLDMLSTLQQRMREHFEHEEAQMARLDYPGFHEHAARHATALAGLCSVEMRLTETMAVDREVLYAIFSPLIDDILRADLPFKTFLHASGRFR